jgi:site-specific recombinase XerD
MLPIPSQPLEQLETYFKNQKIPNNLQWAYKKWLRYYLDFCIKYKYPPDHKDSLPEFIKKLHEKRQTKEQQEQAVMAVKLYYRILDATVLPNKEPASQTTNPPEYVTFKDESTFSIHEAAAGVIEYRKAIPPFPSAHAPSLAVRGSSRNISPSGKAYVVQETGVSWKEEYSRLEDEIRVRHYSSKTLKTYKGWVRKFQTFTRSKNPELLSSDDVKEYLTFLAVKRKVSSTTQNQAFNSLLFFYRHVLRREFGKIDGVVRAKRKPYIPVVLSREEIDSILRFLEPPYDLVVKLLYGCGLRLFECLNLRVHCMNFDAGI